MLLFIEFTAFAVSSLEGILCMRSVVAAEKSCFLLLRTADSNISKTVLLAMNPMSGASI